MDIDYYREEHEYTMPYVAKVKKKKPKKSDHKHNYQPCIFKQINPYNYREDFVGGTYCTICGKIGNKVLFETEDSDYGYSSIIFMTEKQAIEKYGNVPIFEITKKFVELK